MLESEWDLNNGQIRLYEGMKLRRICCFFLHGDVPQQHINCNGGGGGAKNSGAETK